MNRQLEKDPFKPGGLRRVDAPMGVFGYRIDAREFSADPDNPNAWISLCQVRNKADLALGEALISTAGRTAGTGGGSLSRHSRRAQNQTFLAARLFRLLDRKKSGAARTRTPLTCTAKSSNDVMDGKRRKTATKNALYEPVGLETIPLLYGHQYQFRTRLADMTGGGPLSTEVPVYNAEAPVATHHFKRHAIPQTVRMQTVMPEEDGVYFTEDQLMVQRPLLGYPSVLFTGAYPNALDLLKADFDAAAGKRDIGIADPDVDRLEIEVAVRALDMDTTIQKAPSAGQLRRFVHHHAGISRPISTTTSRNVPLHFCGSPGHAFQRLQKPGAAGPVRQPRLD